jgi:hypothetical protein
MTQPQLGRLARVDLRRIWTSEPGGFTPWLAREENLRLLGETLGIELELISEERSVGPFRADILCKDTATDTNVLIENQLERTDHTHLGQLLTYAAGLQAVTIVWIAERFTEEHRAALDWLNERTDDQVNLFGLEIELWQIGDSPVAPKFNVVSQPNDWSKTVREAVAGTGEASEHRQLQLRYWLAFKDYLDRDGSSLRCQKPGARHWQNHAIGRSGVHLASVISTRNSISGDRRPEIRAELVLTGPRSKENFAGLFSRKQAIEESLGFPLTWHNPEESSMCRVFIQRDADFTDEDRWPDQFAWLRTTQETMARCFAPIVRAL